MNNMDFNIQSILIYIQYLFKLLLIFLTKYGIFYNNTKKLRVGFYTYSLKGGGTERVTSIFVNYLSIESEYDIFLFSQKYKEKNEFVIPNSIKRIAIIGNELSSRKKLKKQIMIKKIDVFIYQFPNGKDIKMLNKLQNVKIIIYSHFCFLTWIYCYDNHNFKELYDSYRESKYIVSLVPFENDYIFKKWGINSIFMNNLITYDYDKINPSNLSSKTILMIGRATDKFKRFDLGIKSMKYIIKEVPECEMKIISNLDNISEFKEIVKKLDLENKVKFIGYTSKPEIYFVNASLHIFPTISESFGLVLSETKIFGIPNILTGLDFVTLSEGGTVIIYDDNPETIGKEAIKILIDNNYRKKLGNEARESMKKFNNKLTIKKWIKLINSVYKGDEYYINLTKNEHIILDKDAINILKNQTKLLQKREPFFKNITTQLLLNYTYLLKLLS